MPHKPRVALLLFSNDLSQYLTQVEQERKMVEEAMEHYHDTNRMQVIARSAVSIEEIFRLFNRYRGRIALFHFAGHAEGEGLQLNKNFTDDEMGKAVGLAELFRREATTGSLQLVFLNGCSTEPQVQGLQEAGVPSIIATSRPINDDKALQFARQFYRSLANTEQAAPFDQPTSIQAAFDDALAYLKTKYEIKTEPTTRGIRLELAGEDYREPWQLYTTNPNWTFAFEVAEESQSFNERLTEQLIRAIAPYSRNAQRFLESVADKPGWESETAKTDNAKWIINAKFVGVLGIQLRKLFAIGKEPASEKKQLTYLENCLLTAKRALQLLCFALLSGFWDYQKEKRMQLNAQEEKLLQNFFDEQFELGIRGYADLLQGLLQIFTTQQLELPIPEMKDFQLELEPDGALRKSCDRLQELQQKLDKSQIVGADCFGAERQLSNLLCTFSFLADYKMVSIKAVAYDAMRNAAPHYLHQLTVLGLDIKQNVNQERVNYVEVPVATDAILLYRNKYQEQSINLFPFIIDFNALALEAGAKIYFYKCKDLSDGSLNYTFLEDKAVVENILYKDVLKDNASMNQLMMDAEKRKERKLDIVFEQFRDARQTILQSTEEKQFVLEDEDEDF